MSPKSDLRPLAQEPLEPAPAMAARWPSLVGVASDAFETIQRRRIVCISAGSVASRIAPHCARMQVAQLLIVDPARFKRESLLTHDIRPDSIGRPKSEYVAELCRQLSPSTLVSAIVGRVQDLAPSTLADYDFAFAATDNLHAETSTAQLCLRLGIPLVLAAVHGETLTAQVKLFANERPSDPCPACLFNDQEWRFQDDEAIFSCGGGAAEFRVQPTRSTSFLCSMAADLAVAQAVRWFLGLGASVANTELTWCAYTHRVLLSPLVCNPNCRLEHVAWERAAVSRPVADCTPEELLAAAQMSSQSGVTIAVEGYMLAEKAFCCGREQPLGRFVALVGAAAGACPVCAGPLVPPPFFLRRDVPLKLLPPRATLAQLGASAACGALVSDGSRVVLVRHARGARKTVTCP
jgi:molybdopterin/thiamine biosynthesis adenylyltransferase